MWFIIYIGAFNVLGRACHPVYFILHIYFSEYLTNNKNTHAVCLDDARVRPTHNRKPTPHFYTIHCHTWVAIVDIYVCVRMCARVLLSRTVKRASQVRENRIHRALCDSLHFTAHDYTLAWSYSIHTQLHRDVCCDARIKSRKSTMRAQRKSATRLFGWCVANFAMRECDSRDVYTFCSLSRAIYKNCSHNICIRLHGINSPQRRI